MVFFVGLRKQDIVSRPALISLIAMIAISFLPGSPSAEERVDQEWVIPFDVQQRNDFIWNGKQAKDIKSLEDDFTELNEIQRRYNLNTNIFIIHGYYCTDTHLNAFAPDVYARFIELNSKLESLETSENVSSDSSRLVTLNKEIQQLRASLPPKIDFENYLWHTYCRGIERDVDEEIVVATPDCSCCKGTGKITCPLCKGKGKVGFYNPSIDVIDPDSRTRREFRKQELERKKSLQESLDSSERRRPVSRIPRPFLPPPIPTVNERFGKDRPTREEALRQKEQEKEKRREEMERRRRENEQIQCAICKGRGWCACPDCVLVDKPTYVESAKVKYMPRWSTLKTEKWH